MGAALCVNDAQELGRTVARLMRMPEERESLSAQARVFVGAHEGALERCWAAMAPLLKRTGAEA
jgi:3-deoxy-D-manno-octulosonic-acid transferase